MHLQLRHRNLVIYISDVKQDYIVCDDCKTVLVYKLSTGSSCMINHLRSCQSKPKKAYSYIY